MKKNIVFILIFMLMGVLALTGCGTTEAANGDKTSDNSEAATKTVDTAMGEVDVPTEPQKIATLVGPFADHLLALGIKPHAADSSFEGAEDQFVSYLADQMDGTIKLGGTWTPNMEAILSAEPDLILSIKAVHEKAYGELSKIAPTILLDAPHADWRKALLEVGEIVGKKDLAEQRIEEYATKAEEAGKAIRGEIGDETVLFMRLLPKEIRIYHGKGPQGEVLYTDLGLTPPEGIKMDQEAEAIQMEALTEINPDHIFLLNNSPERIEEFKNHPVWKNLKAVKEGNVYDGSKDVWPYGSGFIAQTTAIDYLIETLTK